jgi:chaperonin cofactor prefoldin
MSEQEQNKRINQLRRQLANAVEQIKTLELDMEPSGRISEGFTAMENHMDEQFEMVNTRFDRIDSRFDRLEHQFNRLQAKMEVILEAITGLGDLPENETN